MLQYSMCTRLYYSFTARRIFDFMFWFFFFLKWAISIIVGRRKWFWGCKDLCNRSTNWPFYLLWKLKAFIAKAKITAKSTQKKTTMTPDTPTKSCLYPRTSFRTCFTGIKRSPSDSFISWSSSPYCDVRSPYSVQAIGFAQ